jgi:hypothetical protein
MGAANSINHFYQWKDVEDDIKLPIQATNEIVRVIFTICKEIQRVNSSILDQVKHLSVICTYGSIFSNLLYDKKSILEDIRKQLFKTTIDAFNTLLDTKDIELTENGALQMIFDYMFLSHVLQQKDNLSSNNKMLSRMQEQVIEILNIELLKCN